MITTTGGIRSYLFGIQAKDFILTANCAVLTVAKTDLTLINTDLALKDTDPAATKTDLTAKGADFIANGLGIIARSIEVSTDSGGKSAGLLQFHIPPSGRKGGSGDHSGRLGVLILHHRLALHLIADVIREVAESGVTLRVLKFL